MRFMKRIINKALRRLKEFQIRASIRRIEREIGAVAVGFLIMGAWVGMQPMPGGCVRIWHDTSGNGHPDVAVTYIVMTDGAGKRLVEHERTTDIDVLNLIQIPKR